MPPQVPPHTLPYYNPAATGLTPVGSVISTSTTSISSRPITTTSTNTSTESPKETQKVQDYIENAVNSFTLVKSVLMVLLVAL